MLLPPANEVAGPWCFYTCLSVILFTGDGSLYNVTSCLVAWSHVPSAGFLSLVPCSFQGVSVSGPMFLLGSLSRVVSLTKTPLDRDHPGRRPPIYRPPDRDCPWTETPPDRDSLDGKERVVRILLECILVLKLFRTTFVCLFLLLL